jgi:microsomal epoxide hydrolase
MRGGGHAETAAAAPIACRIGARGRAHRQLNVIQNRTPAIEMIRRLARYPCTLLLAPALLLMISTSAPAARERDFVTSDGVRLHYREAGVGQSIVFVPGWTMPGAIWSAQMAHFARTHRVIAFDPRGQGNSEVPRSGYTVERRAQDIKELLDHVGAEPVVLVGWSLGVLESLAYAGANGTARLAALVLVDNSIGEEPPPVSDPTFLTRLQRDRVKTVEGFVRGMYRRPQTDAYLRGIVSASLSTPLDASVALLSYPYPRERWREFVYQIDKPLLYAVSARFKGQAENLKKNKSEAWIEVFDQAGHALFVDEAARFNSLLERFLAAESVH